VVIPLKTKEVIFRAGLNGGTGLLGLDNLKMIYLPRKR